MHTRVQNGEAGMKMPIKAEQKIPLIAKKYPAGVPVDGPVWYSRSGINYEEIYIGNTKGDDIVVLCRYRT